jgi:hypothetical protein
VTNKSPLGEKEIKMGIKDSIDDIVEIWYKMHKDVFTLHIWIDEKWKECKIRQREKMYDEFVSGEWFEKLEEELNAVKSNV